MIPKRVALELLLRHEPIVRVGFLIAKGVSAPKSVLRDLTVLHLDVGYGLARPPKVTLTDSGVDLVCSFGGAEQTVFAPWGSLSFASARESIDVSSPITALFIWELVGIANTNPIPPSEPRGRLRSV